MRSDPAGSRRPVAEQVAVIGCRNECRLGTVDADVRGLTAAGSQEQPAEFTFAQLAAALQRVAKLAARDTAPTEILKAVVTEASGLIGGGFTTLLRFEPDGATEVVAVHLPPAGVAVGMRDPAGGDGAAQRVWRTGRPAWGTWPGSTAARRYPAGVATPILAEDRLWGTLIAAGEGARPPHTEEKLALFAELAGTAVAGSQARAEAQALADEQAALLRVAKLVARGGAAEAVFGAVIIEAQRLLDGRPMTLLRFEPDMAMTVISHSEGLTPPVTRIDYTSGTLPDRVRGTARAVRVDDYSTEQNAAFAHRYDLMGGVAAPIVVEGQVWGMLAATPAGGPLAAGVDERLQRFANLVAAAVSHATSRAQLLASRARVLSTADETRRRLQRDIHDGAQQRLVHTVITLKLARLSLADGDLPTSAERVEEALKHAQRATDEFRQIVSGILPASLTGRGLLGGVESLLADLPLPVDAAIEVPRMAVDVETTAYFVIAEALTNVVKHAGATRAWVGAALSADTMRIEVTDNGIGGARAERGSGLTGLFDRVEARGGRLRVHSPRGKGTTIEAILPVGDQPPVPGQRRMVA